MVVVVVDHISIISFWNVAILFTTPKVAILIFKSNVVVVVVVVE